MPNTKKIEKLLTEQVVNGAIEFMDDWFTKRFDFRLGDADIRKDDVSKETITVTYPVEKYGRNMILPEFLKEAFVSFRIAEVDKKILIYSVHFWFKHLEGGSNGWRHPSKFTRGSYGFIEHRQ